LTEKDSAAESAAAAADAATAQVDNGDSAGGAEAASAAQLVREELESVRRQADENRDKYLRAVADLDNLRKRTVRELEGARRFGAERLIAALLPVRDSLEASLDAAARGSRDLDAVLEGDRATLRLLSQAFTDAGVAEIDPEGEPFDPNRHEAMSLMPSQTVAPNSVIAVVQKGYSLHDRVVRPARVVVATAPPEAEGSG
jgi:molecular chaperone GrpE